MRIHTAIWAIVSKGSSLSGCSAARTTAGAASVVKTRPFTPSVTGCTLKVLSLVTNYIDCGEQGPGDSHGEAHLRCDSIPK